MQIPYMKVAVYALTFMGYCYSGFGSGILTNLRDAILSAEIVFGDVLKNLVVAARKFKLINEVFDKAVEENCVYKCPGNSGILPVKNKLHNPSYNGCGALGLNIDYRYLPSADMDDCCNEHDVCYDTCNSDKELCDLDFKRCLFKICDTYDKPVVGDVVVKSCKAAAKVVVSGAMALGCKSFLDAQEKACYCPTPKQTEYPNKDKDRDKRKDKGKKPYGWKNTNDL